MIVKAFAKINLGLSVLKKRQDGYHDLATVFAEVGIYDVLSFSLLEHSSIKFQILSSKSQTNPDFKIPNDQTNLVVQAAQLLQQRYQVQHGVSIRLTKKIPIGAGLGGGSSDAAATLVALNKLWRLKLSSTALEQLGAELGSDVPFFIRGGVQAGAGRGEVLRPATLPRGFPRHVVLVSPPVHISTAWAYGQLTVRQRDSKQPKIVIPDKRSAIRDPENKQQTNFNNLQNTFESVVFAKYPELAAIKQQLLACGARVALLSGSGSTVFGLFADRPPVSLRGVFPHYQVVLTQIQARRPHR